MICPKCGYIMRMLTSHTVPGSTLGECANLVTGWSCWCGKWVDVFPEPVCPMPKKVVKQTQVKPDGTQYFGKELIELHFKTIDQLRTGRVKTPWRVVLDLLNIKLTPDVASKNYMQIKLNGRQRSERTSKCQKNRKVVKNV